MQSQWRDRRTLHEILSERNPPNDNLGIAYASFVCTVRGGYSPGIMLKNHPLLRKTVVDELQKRFEQRAREGLYHSNSHGEYIPPLGKFDADTIEGMVTELARKGRFEDIGAAVREGAQDYQRRMVERGMHNYQISAEYRAIKRALQKQMESR